MKTFNPNKDSQNRFARFTKFLSRLIREIAKLDHSISVPSLGSLFRFDTSLPLGMAQQDTAEIFGMPFSYPSTNGTTPLNVMGLMTFAYPGDKVLIQRDSHVSILAGIQQVGARPVYLTPRFDNSLGVTVGVTPEELKHSLDTHPDVRLIVLTYPTYNGIAGEIDKLVSIASEKNIPIMVDSAHGAHWNFNPNFPVRPEQVGASLVTLSIHKTCPVLGQGSLLLLNDSDMISRFYEVVNNSGYVSTSFSFVILTALFYGLWKLHEDGGNRFQERLDMAAWAREEINQIDGLHSFGLEDVQQGFVDLDPLRFTIDVSGIGLTGYEVEDILIQKHGHYAEMATIQNILFLISLGHTWRDIRRLVGNLKDLVLEPHPRRNLPNLTQPSLPDQVLTPREAFFNNSKRTVSTKDAIGLVSAETISAYPPGSAVIVAGELITNEAVDFLKEVRFFGAVLKGASDPDFKFIQVINL